MQKSAILELRTRRDPLEGRGKEVQAVGKTSKKSKKAKTKGNGRGKKYTEKERGKVRELLAMGYSVHDISERTKIPESTIRSWKVALLSETPEELAKVRAEKRAALAGKVWDDAILAEELLARRLERALKVEDGLDTIIGIVMSASEEEMAPETRRNILRQLEGLRFDRPGDITQVFGTMVDKHAKLMGDDKTHVELSGTVGTRLEDT